MVVINLWGAPGSGKSTTAGGLFFLMKINKKKVEQVHEYAKDLIYEKNFFLLADQNHVLAEQNRRQNRLAGSCDFAITDSPLLLSAIYQPTDYSKEFLPFVMAQFDLYDNLNYFLHRVTDYEKIGRRHNEEQSQQKENEIRSLMERYNIPYTDLDATPETPQIIFEDVMKRMHKSVVMSLFPSKES